MKVDVTRGRVAERPTRRSRNQAVPGLIEPRSYHLLELFSVFPSSDPRPSS